MTNPQHRLYAALTDRIMESAKYMYDHVGPGHRKEIYAAGLSAALQRSNHDVWRRVRARASDAMCIEVADLVIDERVAVKIVTTASVHTDQIRQLRKWLHANGVLAIGLVFSFGGEHFEARYVPAEDNYDARWP